MAKPKTKDIVLLAVSIIFILTTFSLYSQNGSLKATVNKLQVEVDDLLKMQDSLKQQLEETNAKLAEQAALAASLQEQLTVANNNVVTLSADKESLVNEMKMLKGEQQPMQPVEPAKTKPAAGQ